MSRKQAALRQHSSSGDFGDSTDDDRERTQAKQAALSAGAAMLKATFNNIRQGFILLDDQLRVLSFNSRFSELIGFPPGLVCVGATAYSLISASVALGNAVVLRMKSMGTSLKEFLYPRRRQAVASNIVRYVKPGSPVTLRKRSGATAGSLRLSQLLE